MKSEEQFFFRDGSQTASLDELRDKIEIISYDEFYHHVTSSRNDFANWIRYVLKDPQLADQLEKVNSIVETVEILNDYLQPRAKKEVSDIQSRIENLLDIQIPEERKNLDVEEPTESPKESPEKIKEIPTLAQATQEENQETNQETNQQDELVHESHHYARSKQEKEELETFHHQLDRIIVKDFIWGMIFGLIVGFILARVLVL